MTHVAWEPVEHHDIAGRGRVYCGPWPFDDTAASAAIGRTLIVGGVERVIRGVEWYSIGLPPQKGDNVGILFRD